MSSRSKRVAVQANSETILVVEPDIFVRMVISDYLRECGYKVIEAISSDEAVTVLGTDRKVDAVFSEVKLKGTMDGFALAQWVRANRPQVEVILTTGVKMAAKKAGELCEEGPLDKPYHPQELVQRLKRLFNRRGNPET